MTAPNGSPADANEARILALREQATDVRELHLSVNEGLFLVATHRGTIQLIQPVVVKLGWNDLRTFVVQFVAGALGIGQPAPPPIQHGAPIGSPSDWRTTRN